jgi:hypothetical protein
LSVIEFDARFRLRQLHRLLLNEIDRHAHDSAVSVLKQIAREAKSSRIKSDPEAPSVDVEVRLGFWRQLFDHAAKHRFIVREMQILECMRREDTQRGVAA